MIILPIWLWIVIIVVVMGGAGIAWLRKVAVADPRAARAVTAGRAIADASLVSFCKARVMEHELTIPGQTRFLAVLSPLEFRSGKSHARTPISLALTDHTLGVTYKKGALGDRTTTVIKRREITATSSHDSIAGLGCTIETSRQRSLEFFLESEEDRWRLALWARGEDIASA